MQLFYKAQSLSGNIEEGIAEAANKTELSKILKDKGFMLVFVKEQKPSGINIPFIDNLFGRIKMSAKIIFARSLSGMLSAGLSLSRALSVFEKQTQNEHFKKIMTALNEDINHGGTLSSGMAKFPKVFSTLFISMIRAGEESGSLSKSLLEISSNLEKIYSLNKKIKGAMTYPSIILGAMVLIGTFMLIYVVPTLTSTFKDFDAELPSTTKFVIFISDSVTNHSLLFLLVIVLVISIFMYFFRSKSTQYYADLLLIKLPIIGKMVKEVNSARTARTLASLLASGVDITRALGITREVIQNVHYRKVIDKAVEGVQKGVPLSTAFKERTDLYPVMVGEMMEVGEETGKVSDMLTEIAVFYEQEVDEKTKNLSTIIEPILMVIIGGGVGFFAVSMITPMYSLLDSI